MLLVIDIGNTHVDLGLFSVEQAIAAQTAEFVQDLVRHTKYPTDAAVPNNLQQLFASLTSPLDGVAIGSVVTGLADDYANLCRPYCRGPVVEVTGRWDWGLHIDYDDADRVGVDRLAAAAAAYHHPAKRQAAIIADAGTALTIDAVDAKGTFLGGAIAPGLRLGLQALSTGTSLLPPIEIDAAAPLLARERAVVALRVPRVRPVQLGFKCCSDYTTSTHLYFSNIGTRNIAFSCKSGVIITRWKVTCNHSDLSYSRLRP